jgi:hypothetical protein
MVVKVSKNQEPSEDLLPGKDSGLPYHRPPSLVVLERLWSSLINGLRAVNRRYKMKRFRDLTNKELATNIKPIIVYQMGKVGSRTAQISIIEALKKLNLDIPVYHIHNLANLDKMEERLLTANATRPNPADTLMGIRQGKELLEKIKTSPGRHWNLVSLVRDPIAQNVGAFFHNMHEFFPNWKQDFQMGRLTIEQLQHFYINKYRHIVTKVWFEQQMEPVWGINVYASPFPKETGYKIYHGAQADLLLIRLEDLNRAGGHALEEFLEIKNVEIINQNVAEEKEYRDIYREFRKRPLPADFVEEMYNSHFVQHFYTPEEISEFRYRWSKVLARPPS